MKSAVRAARIAVLALVAVALFAPSSGALPITGSHPWVVVLCNFSDDTSQPQPVSYYQQMFNGAPGADGLREYYNDVSYGNLSITGTVVKGWYTLSMTRYVFSGLSRYNKIKACAEAADADVDYGTVWGVFAITNFPVDGLPTPAASTVPAATNSSQTTITVASSAGFPAPPFAAFIADTTANNGEEVNVTGVSGNDWTVTRGYQFGPAKSHAAGAAMTLVYGSDYGNVGLIASFPMDGGHNLGNVVGGWDFNVSGAAHEMGHGFGFEHSRKLSDSTNDYNDCWDIMSVFSCVSTFQGSFGGTNLNSQVAAAGDGFTAINLDLGGWLSPSRLTTVDNSACNQTTLSLAGLNHPEVLGALAARIPDVTTIPIPSSTTNSDYLWLEHRDKSGWDRGILANAIVLHLHGADNRPYWVDSAGGDGKLDAGEAYVDAGRNVYIAVNSIDGVTHLARVTIAGCKLNATFAYTGDTTGDFNDQVTLSGDLEVAGSLAPVPNKSVTLSLGTQSCIRITDAAGHASCTITITQHPGTYTATGSFPGDTAYNTATDPDTLNFSITKEETRLAYSGATSSDYHDSFTATATLTDPVDGTPIAGKTVHFDLDGVDTCNATTSGSGVASCPITPTQTTGSHTLHASFGPDVDYENASTSAAFTIEPEETTISYTGPTVILAGSGTTVTLAAHLVEDGANDDDADGGAPAPVPPGQSVTLTLGSQSCTGTTNAAGDVVCTISPVSVGTLGPRTITATFAGDTHYAGSSDSASAIVFAFPSRGAFVLGDTTVAGAGTSTVTWWSSSWWSLDSLSGGIAPPSFKGFAGTVSTLPATSPVSTCGSSFTTATGNSPPPTGSVPSYMGVLVADHVTKSGSTINGTWARIVVVRTDPGYGPSPGHPGTGQVVATFCH